MATKARKYKENEIISLIYKYAAQNGADARLMVAVATVESGLDNLRVGDNGTSFGLYQHHIGGAGGTTKASAMQYLDAEKSIEERSRAFTGAKTGTDAARIQRPLKPVDYAKKVDKILAGLPNNIVVATQTGQVAQSKPKWSPLRDEIRQIANKQYHLTHTSGNRATKLTSSGNVSDHYAGKTESWADDYSGTKANMAAFEQDMLARSDLKQVLGPSTAADHQDHVHVAGFTAKGVAGATSGAGAAGDTQNVGLFSDATGAIGGAVTTAGKYLTILLIVLLGGVLVVFGVIKSSGGA